MAETANPASRPMSLPAKLLTLVVALLAIPFLWLTTVLHAGFMNDVVVLVVEIFLIVSVIVIVIFPTFCFLQRGRLSWRMLWPGFWPWGLKYYPIITAAISLGLVGFLYKRLSISFLGGYPSVYIFYVSCTMGIIIFIFLTALASDWVRTQVVWYVGNFIKNNNCRWWTLAILFVNFVLVCLMLPPTPGISVEKVEGVANKVWELQPLRDFFGFILWGNDGVGHRATKPLFDVASQGVVIGWWHVWTAIALGALTLITMPFAYRDEVIVWMGNLRATREAGKETKEEKPLQVAGTPVSGSAITRGWQGLVNFGLLDMFWEALYFF